MAPSIKASLASAAAILFAVGPLWGQVYSVAFSPDGRTLASGSMDNSIKLWDVAGGRELRTLTRHEGNVDSVAFSPNGHTLASGGRDNTIKLWDVAGGRALRTIPGFTQPQKPPFGPPPPPPPPPRSL